MFLICGLKFSLSSNRIPKSSTEVNSYVLICVTSFLFIYYYYLKLVWVYYIWLFLNQSVITSESLCKILINFDIFSAKADNLLSSAKLCTNAINMKKNQSLIDRFNKKGPSIDPRGTPVTIFSNSLSVSLILTQYLRKLIISTILMQCLLNVLATVFSSVVTTSFSTRIISLLPMKPLFVRKCLINFQETFIIVYSFFRDAFQMLFQRFSA